MNKRILNRIMRLWNDGLGTEDVIKIIIEMSKNSEEASFIICQHFVKDHYMMGGREKHDTYTV